MRAPLRSFTAFFFAIPRKEVADNRAGGAGEDLAPESSNEGWYPTGLPWLYYFLFSNQKSRKSKERVRALRAPWLYYFFLCQSKERSSKKERLVPMAGVEPAQGYP